MSTLTTGIAGRCARAVNRAAAAGDRSNQIGAPARILAQSWAPIHRHNLPLEDVVPRVRSTKIVASPAK